MNDKIENIINAKYYTKKGLIKEGKFNSNSTFGQILDYFKKNNKNIFFKLKPKYIFNGEIVKNNQLISKLIHIDKNCSLKFAEIWIEINNEFNDKTGEQDIIQKKILKPKKNPFGILVITPSKDSISLEKYPEYTTKKFNLYDFNYTSAYCDSPNFLFISGGEQKSKILDNFWIIEHELYNIENKKMPYPKKNHSMIYIEEGLVYIVGGNNNITFFYDLEKDEFIKCGNLIQVCLEPTLLRINDFIYCLSSLKDKNFFERIKISRMSGNWEKVNVFISPENKIKFTNNFFGALNMGDGNLIICGGNENSFIFNCFSHTLIKTDEKDENIELGDKRLYPIDNNYYIGISRYFEENKEIIILNKKTKKLKKIKCSTAEIIGNHFNDIKIKQDEANDKEDDLNGSVSVNAVITMNNSKGVFTIKNLGPNLEDKFNDFLKEQKEFLENNLRKNNKEISDKEINYSINNEISSKKKIDDLSDNLGFLEVKVINPINDKNIKNAKNIKNKNSPKNFRNIFVKETNLKFRERYDKDDEYEEEEEEEEDEEFFCNNFQYNISEKCSEVKKSRKDKENYNVQMNKKISKKKNEEIIIDKIDKDNFEKDKLNNKQYNNNIEKSIENIKEILEENNKGKKEEKNEINKEKTKEESKKEYKGENNEGNKEKNNEKNKQEYDNNPNNNNNNNNNEQAKNEKNYLLEVRKEEADIENNIDKQKEDEKEKEHKEKYDNLKKNILDFQSTSDIYVFSQNQLSELSPEKEKTTNQNKHSSEAKNQNSNNNSPPVLKQLNDSSDISDFKYYQNRLEHFEKKFNINYKNEKCKNKIDASNKITKQNLNSLFTPVVNRARYPKIESSSPYISLKKKEHGFLAKHTNKEENPNPMYSSLKEFNINGSYSSLYEKILKKQEDGINFPVIDSSKIYQFQK